jgi:hypothetical protein
MPLVVMSGTWSLSSSRFLLDEVEPSVSGFCFWSLPASVLDTFSSSSLRSIVSLVSESTPSFEDSVIAFLLVLAPAFDRCQVDDLGELTRIARAYVLK